MQLNVASDSTIQHRGPWVSWISSVVFSLLVLAGYRVLEEREFLPWLGLLALLHVFAVVARVPSFSLQLFLSQTLVVVSSLVSVYLHTSHAVGETPAGLSRTLGSFIQADLSSLSAYAFFAVYLAVFCLVLAVLLLAIQTFRLRTRIDSEVGLVMAYTMSAVNIAFDYSLLRPLYHVSGDADARTFFFAAGLFGTQFSLALHLLVFTVCLAWHLLTSPHVSIGAGVSRQG